MELNGAKILYTIHTNIPVLGDFKITQTLVSTWIVMALLSALAFWLGRDLKLENVSKRAAGQLLLPYGNGLHHGIFLLTDRYFFVSCGRYSPLLIL